jgi:hypothetical protein
LFDKPFGRANPKPIDNTPLIFTGKGKGTNRKMPYEKYPILPFPKEKHRD